MDSRETTVVEQAPAMVLPANPAPAASASAPPPALPCANCAAPLSGPFCAQCGQHVADYHRSIRRLVGDFFETLFSWDSKILRTLGPLLQRPGFLTNEFMVGRRVRYVQPLKLFLFTSAVCLALIHLGGGDNAKARDARARKHGAKAAQHQTPADGQEKKPVVPVVSPALPGESPAGPAPSVAPGTSPGGDVPMDRAALKTALRDAFKGKSSDKNAGAIGALTDQLVDATAQKIDSRGGVEKSIDAVSENFRQRLSWVALAMLPIFALGLRSLYRREDHHYFAHLIFSLHYHTFLLLFWVGYTWVNAVFGETFLHTTELLLCVPPVHLFLALRRVYGGSARRTGVKTFVLGAMHLLAIFVGLCIVGASSLFSALR